MNNLHPPLPPSPEHASSGDSEDPLSLELPPEYASLVRSVTMDSVAAEEQPWLRDRLRPFLAVFDPEAAALLEVNILDKGMSQ